MLRFDLHVHSNFSRDGYDSIDSILKRAKEIGLNGIAITDHNTIEGGLTGAKMAGALGLDLMVIPGVGALGLDLMVIPGVEVSTARGHLVVLGITKDIPPDLPVDETIKIARDMGGIVIVPHPFHPFRHGLGYIPKGTWTKRSKSQGIWVESSSCLIHFIHFAMDWVTFQRVQMPSRCTTLGASQGIRIGVRGTQQHVWA